MSVLLLGIGKASFHRFLAAPVNLHADIGLAMLIDTLLAVFPDMSHRHLDVVGAARAAHQQRTVLADLWIRLVLPVTNAVRRPVADTLLRRADIHIGLLVINILALVNAGLGTLWK